MLELEDVIGNIDTNWRAASLVFFVNEQTKEILLGRHTRGPFLGTYSGVGGKFEVLTDGDIRDCAIRESEQELGVLSLEKNRLQLISVLVCDTEGGMNWRVPVYTYTILASQELPYTQNCDGMDEIGRYSSSQLPAPLKGGTRELIDHIHSGSHACAYFNIKNKKEEESIRFCEIEKLSDQEYTERYLQIMQ